MRELTDKEVNAIIEKTWNACVDFHNNQGENDVKYPDLDELKAKIARDYKKYEFRKVVFIGEDSQDSFPMEEDIEFDTLGYYENNPDGTQTQVDQLLKEDMEKFRQQDDFEEIMLKLRKK